MTRLPLDESLLVFATRYMLGRMSYGVGLICDEIVCAWPTLQRKTQVVLHRDIREHGEQGHSYGHECDQAAWQRVLALRVKEDAPPPS